MTASDVRRGTAALVSAALHEQGRAVSAQELYRLLHQRGQQVGLATVYRALDALVASGAAERIRRDAEDTYVLCPDVHHHHAICRECGQADVLPKCEYAGAAPLQSEHGIVIDAHQTVYFGRCPDCMNGRLHS